MGAGRGNCKINQYVCGGKAKKKVKAKSFVQKRVILRLGARICNFCEV